MRKALFIIFTLCNILPVYAQRHLISGKVYLAGNIPLPGATVVVKGTENGTSSGTDGRYSLLVNHEEAVVVTVQYTGLPTIEKLVRPGQQNNIVIKERKSSSSLATLQPAQQQATAMEAAATGELLAYGWNDVKEWDWWYFLQSKKTWGIYQEYWKIYPQDRIQINLHNEQNESLPDVAVELYSVDGLLLWSGRTNRDGAVQLWPHIFNDNKARKYVVRVMPEGQEPLLFGKIKYDNADIFINVPGAEPALAKNDVVFIMNMGGLQLNEANALKQMVPQLLARAEKDELDLKAGFSVAQGDAGTKDSFRQFSLAEDYSHGLNWFTQTAEVQPEADKNWLPAALENALLHPWSEDNSQRTAFIFADNAPDCKTYNIAFLQDMISKFAAKGIKLVPVMPNNTGPEAEILFRMMAIATNGSVIFYERVPWSKPGPNSSTKGKPALAGLENAFFNLLLTTPMASARR